MLGFWCFGESLTKIKIIIALEKGSSLEELIFRYTNNIGKMYKMISYCEKQL